MFDKLTVTMIFVLLNYLVNIREIVYVMYKYNLFNNWQISALKYPDHKLS